MFDIIMWIVELLNLNNIISVIAYVLGIIFLIAGIFNITNLLWLLCITMPSVTKNYWLERVYFVIVGAMLIVVGLMGVI